MDRYAMPDLSPAITPHLAWFTPVLSGQVGVFCLRLACGVSGMLAVLSPRQVESGFFCRRLYLVLGLAVVVLLSQIAETPGGDTVWYLALVTAVASYVGSAVWLLQWVRTGRAILLLLTALTVAGVVLTAAVPASGSPGAAWLSRAAPLASAAVLGAIVVAMLLGHAYLVAPNMSLAPLKQLLVVLAAALVVRGMLAGLAAALFWSGTGPADGGATPVPFGLLFAVRLLAGIIAPLVLVAMTWQTLKIRSTQSATGILYAAVAMVFLGELTAQWLAPSAGMPV
jgi:hypothetical protein